MISSDFLLYLRILYQIPALPVKENVQESLCKAYRDVSLSTSLCRRRYIVMSARVHHDMVLVYG